MNKIARGQGWFLFALTSALAGEKPSQWMSDVAETADNLHVPVEMLYTPEHFAHDLFAIERMMGATGAVVFKPRGIDPIEITSLKRLPDGRAARITVNGKELTIEL